jgi:hypothetical protein
MAFALFGVAALVGTLFLLPGNLAAVFGRNPLAVQTVVPLLAVDFLLGLAWWHSGKGELGTLRAIGDEFIPAVPWYAPLLVVGAAATFVALTVASLSPVSFGVVLLVLKTQESLNSWVARRAIRHGAIALLRSPRADPDRKHRTLVVTDYYFGHPWDAWATIEIFLVALAIAFGAFLLNEADSSLQSNGMFAISLLIAAIVAGNEFVVHVWRQDRNNRLDEPPTAGPDRSLGTDWPEAIAPEAEDVEKSFE